MLEIDGMQQQLHLTFRSLPNQTKVMVSMILIIESRQKNNSIP